MSMTLFEAASDTLLLINMAIYLCVNLSCQSEASLQSAAHDAVCNTLQHATIFSTEDINGFTKSVMYSIIETTEATVPKFCLAQAETSAAYILGL